MQILTINKSKLSREQRSAPQSLPRDGDQSVSRDQHQSDVARDLLPAGKSSSLQAEHSRDESDSALMSSSASVPSRMVDVGLNTSWNSSATASSDVVEQTNASALTFSQGVYLLIITD